MAHNWLLVAVNWYMCSLLVRQDFRQTAARPIATEDGRSRGVGMEIPGSPFPVRRRQVARPARAVAKLAVNQELTVHRRR